MGGELATRISSEWGTVGRGGGPPPSHHFLEASGAVRRASRPSDMAIPAFRAAPERLRRLRSGSRMPPILSWTVQNGENPVQNHPKLSSRSSESSNFTFSKICTFAQIEPANDAPGAPPRLHFEPQGSQIHQNGPERWPSGLTGRSLTHQFHLAVRDLSFIDGD